MKTDLNVSLIGILFLAALWGGCAEKPTSPDSGGAGSENVVSRDSLVVLLTDLRDSLRAGIAPEDIAAVESHVAQFPAVSGSQPPVVNRSSPGDSVSEIRASITTKDWAYAESGVWYTLQGGLAAGHDRMLDVAFWCFLEAAALRPDEIEHLGNVGFHLNERRRHADAETVLEYARSLDSLYVPVCTNLAFALTAGGKYDKAIAETQRLISLIPEADYLKQALASRYEAAGYEDMAAMFRGMYSDSADSADTVLVPPMWIPPMNLSEKARAILVEIERLGEACDSALAKAWQKYEPDIQRLLDDFYDRWAGIVQDWADCQFRVATNGGDAYAICVNCHLPAGNKAYDLYKSVVSSMMPYITAFESEAHGIVDDYSRKGIRLANEANVSTGERGVLREAAYYNIVAANAYRLAGPRKQLSILRETIEDAYSEAEAEGCGDAPVGELERVVDSTSLCYVVPMACKRIVLFFFYGSLTLDPDGTASLSIGQGVNAKLEYNFDTGHAGFGVGVGFGIGKVIGVGGSVMFKSKTGVEAGVDAGFQVPAGVMEDVKITSVKYGGFENR